MKILLAILSVIILSLLFYVQMLYQELSQAQKIIDTFTITIDSGNFESPEAIKDYWDKMLEENNYTVTGKYCSKDSSGTCVE